jgi:hypothetical protein
MPFKPVLVIHYMNLRASLAFAASIIEEIAGNDAFGTLASPDLGPYNHYRLRPLD